MHLKSLEIHGFKSFAEKAVLDFPGFRDGRYGITAIVGPNGSGKSNIVDAIRWVMGEQSMKTLRGKKGADVIFSGSAGKGKMGVATVAMTLDNRDGHMPLPFEDVVVARRIDQSGESVYLVAGAAVRLFDLQVLLAQAQFGHGSYGTIGQGMIEQLIVHTPKERKEFFDEACGIKEFQIKRHQASLKLERVGQHMREAELLLAEMTPRMKTLSRQVKKLEERQDVEQKLRERRESYYATLWHDAEIQLTALRAERGSMAEDIDERREAARGMATELAGLGRGEEYAAAFSALRKEQERLTEEKQRAREEQAVIDTKLNMEPGTANGRDAGSLRRAVESARANSEHIRHLRHAEASAAETATQEVRALDAAFAAARDRREELRRQIGAEESEIRELGESDVVPPPEARAVEAVLAGGDRFGKVFGTVASLARPVDERYTLALDVAAGHHVSSLVTEDDRVAERWVHHLRENKIGVASFLPRTLVKPRVPPQDIGTLLALPGVFGLATDLVRFEDRFRSVFSFVFGTTLIVESFAEARAVGIGRVRMVTMSGDVFETSGSVKGGYRAKRRGAASFSDSLLSLSRAKRIAEKEQAIAAWTAELQSLEGGRAPAEEALRLAYRKEEQTRARLALLVERERDSHRELQSLSDDDALRAEDPARLAEAMAGLAERSRETSKRIREIDAALFKAHAEEAAFQKREAEKQTRAVALQGALRDAEEAIRQSVEQLHAREVDIARVETKAEDVVRESAQELGEDIHAVVLRGVPTLPSDAIPAAMEEMQKLKYALSLIGGIDEAVLAEFSETRERHDGLTRELDDLTRAMSDLKMLVGELDDIMKKKRQESFWKIRKEFARFFSVLFGGGKADLLEVYGEETDFSDQTSDISTEPKSESRSPKTVMGIDVVAHPPGKKIMHIQSLSGGERTMTALALLAAILHTNPPPFVVLDEVEAALDEANTVRFGTILQELTRVSQCILITHNRATMHIADVLYGVTMGGEGVSRLVSVKLPDPT